MPKILLHILLRQTYQPTFVTIDEQYADWYKYKYKYYKFKKTIDSDSWRVLSVQRALYKGILNQDICGKSIFTIVFSPMSLTSLDHPHLYNLPKYIQGRKCLYIIKASGQHCTYLQTWVSTAKEIYTIIKLWLKLHLDPFSNGINIEQRLKSIFKSLATTILMDYCILTDGWSLVIWSQPPSPSVLLLLMLYSTLIRIQVLFSLTNNGTSLFFHSIYSLSHTTHYSWNNNI